MDFRQQAPWSVEGAVDERVEQLDAVVWQEILRLLEDPSLLQVELDRRLHAAQTADPLKRREDALRRDQARQTKSMERLLTGYQENLITLEELRCRMPELRKQQRAIEAELQSLEMTAVDPTRNLRLVETLTEFRTRLRARGDVLEVAERQRVVRLLVQEILISGDNITIRHSIPMPASSPDSNDGVRSSREPPEPNTGSCYLLRSNSQRSFNNVANLERGSSHLPLVAEGPTPALGLSVISTGTQCSVSSDRGSATTTPNSGGWLRSLALSDTSGSDEVFAEHRSHKC